MAVVGGLRKGQRDEVDTWDDIYFRNMPYVLTVSSVSCWCLLLTIMSCCDVPLGDLM